MGEHTDWQVDRRTGELITLHFVFLKESMLKMIQVVLYRFRGRCGLIYNPVFIAVHIFHIYVFSSIQLPMKAVQTLNSYLWPTIPTFVFTQSIIFDQALLFVFSRVVWRMFFPLWSYLAVKGLVMHGLYE
jgi:hypothetical protein